MKFLTRMQRKGKDMIEWECSSPIIRLMMKGYLHKVVDDAIAVNEKKKWFRVHSCIVL
jgi:hypothetical protein